MANKKIIEEIVADECDGRYCVLKEILAHSGMTDRTMMQLKCIEKFKFEESCREGHDIGWGEATRLWVDKGYATRFSIGYGENRRFDSIYREVVYGR